MSIQYSIERRLGKRICLEQMRVGLPRYAKFQTCTIASNELSQACAITCAETTHQIFVVTQDFGIRVFSEAGEFLYQLDVEGLFCPLGITIHKDIIYVCCGDHTVSKISLIDMSLVRKIGYSGSDDEQFFSPTGITTDPIGRVFIADHDLWRICIHDSNLNRLRIITPKPLSQPLDLKVHNDCLYVLFLDTNPCIQVLTLDGDKLQSLITCGRGNGLINPTSFCFDSMNNFVICDFRTNSIHIFSPNGMLLHTVGKSGDKQKMLCRPRGVAITPNGRIVCFSENENYALQIFC